MEQYLGYREPVEAPASRTVFYVGGQYVSDGRNGTILEGQMYVEHLRPVFASSPQAGNSNGIKLQRYPLVFIHGAAQTGTNWLNTPDGREGWASYFLRQGYDVYIVDQPGRGRSQHVPADMNSPGGGLIRFSVKKAELQFTAPAKYNKWPQAKLHTQWPGTGVKGDSIFDALYATQLQYDSNNARTATLTQAALCALLDRIGPAVLFTHSQSGPFGFLAADSRPALVRLLVSLEPHGPPFADRIVGSAMGGGVDTDNTSDKIVRPWGLTSIPITYDPPVHDPATDLPRVNVPAPADANGTRTDCYRQAEPARRLPNVAKVPHIIVTSEAGYYATYDHCTVEYLRQAGVDRVEHFRLEEAGLHGNSHLFFMELNNLQIAEALHQRIIKYLQ